MNRISLSALSFVGISGAFGLLGVMSGTGGCSSSSNNGPPDTAHYASYMASAFCGALQSCCAQKSIQYDDGSCTAQMTLYFQSDARKGVDSVKHGKVVYSASAAAQCAQAYKDREGRCSETDSGITITEAGIVDPIRTACAGVLKGTVQPGQACDLDVECATPDDQSTPSCASDTQNPPSGGPIPRVCYVTKTNVAPGSPCTGTGYNQAQCAPTQGFCADAQGQLAQNGTCKAYANVGEACTFTTQNGIILCNPLNATCDLNTQKCVALPGPGEKCAQSSFGGLNGQGCTLGNYCDRGQQGTGTGTCTPLKNDGDVCTQSAQCGSGVCQTPQNQGGGGGGGGGGGNQTGTCIGSGMNDISPRTCGFGPQSTGPEDAGIQPPAK